MNKIHITPCQMDLDDDDQYVSNKGVPTNMWQSKLRIYQEDVRHGLEQDQDQQRRCLRTAFYTMAGQQLHTQANAQQRTIDLKPNILDPCRPACRIQRMHPRSESTNPRQNNMGEWMLQL